MPKRNDIDSVLIIGAGPIYHHRDYRGFRMGGKGVPVWIQPGKRPAVVYVLHS